MNAIATIIDIATTEKNIATHQTTVNILLKEIRETIRAIMEQAKPLGDDEFWALMDEFKKSLSYKRNNHKSAALALIHNITCGHTCDGDRETALRFAKTYSMKVQALYKPLFNAIESCSDDGFSDILDSFPLFGRERYEMALNSEFKGSSNNQYQGENYVATALEDAVLDQYAASCRSEYAPDSEPEPF